jgi:hypothetical protein
MALINSKWRKDAGSTAGNALARVAGSGIAAVILEKLTSADFTGKSDVNKTIGNLAGPVVSLLGIAGDLFLAEPMLKAACQGMYAMAVPKSVAVIAPSIGSYMGLTGLDETAMPAIMNGVKTPAIMNGVGNPRVVTYTPRPAVQAARPATAAPAVDPEQSIRGLAEAMLINN